MSYQFINRCNGSSIGNIKFSESAYHLVMVFIKQARLDFSNLLLNGLKGDFEFGNRYYDNESVLDRIESAATEYEFLENPDGWVMDALRDCASADHWYTYEKQY